ncbi:diguanylate cyclase domain-containing protein [Glaciecola siphonariae]|uniref:diguanylate cyclase n=1 Tax=Glaciecola siphonariae TaxID=521012 RepID=A0ABV9LZZ4_9ALTE
MLLRQKLNLFIALTGVLATLMTYGVSIWVLDNFLAKRDYEQKEALTASIRQDIEVFDRLLLLIEQEWETELEQSLPKLASELQALYTQKGDVTQAQLLTLRDKYSLSDLHLINSDLIVYASTFDSEVGLDMTSYGDDYTSSLRKLLNADTFFTHRVSLSTVNGNLKKYAYYSQAGSNIIVNGDIDLQKRLEEEKSNQIGDYLFGDYVDKLVAKYQSISSIDLFILSPVDQWSLFNPGHRIEEETARALFDGTYRDDGNDNMVLEHVDMQSYRQVGFKAFLQIDFDNSLIRQTKSNLQTFLLLSALIIVIVSFSLIRLITKTILLDRFSQLLLQIKGKQSDDSDPISLSGDDELSILSNEINEMMARIKREEETNKWLTGISQKDSLTGLANRRWFDEKFLFDWNKARIARQDIAIVMIDVDYFKQYNDSYGHLAGDKCLTQIAEALLSQLNHHTGFIARYGGEEFVCVLPNVGEQAAYDSCEKMRECIEDLAIEHEASQVSDVVTISLGCLSVNGSVEQSAEALIEAVDQLLYESKRNGRNRVTCKRLS